MTDMQSRVESLLMHMRWLHNSGSDARTKWYDDEIQLSVNLIVSYRLGYR